MTGRRRFFLLCGVGVLLALAGCGRSMLQGERAAWRGQAEAQCMQSGAVKISPAVTPMQPIEGPGMCGADFPLKVAALGESARMSYSDVPRPPGGVGNSSNVPNWPPTQARYAPPMTAPSPSGAQLRWTPGPPPIEAPDVMPSRTVAPQSAPPYDPPAPAGRPMSIYAPGVAVPDDIPDDAILPSQRGPSQQRMQPAYNAPVQTRPAYAPQQRSLPPLGPQATGAIQPVAVTPAATLSCPIVSALDRWVSDGVQPAAMRWFGAPVTEIKQISAYSCRGMVGAGISHVSEHAFGNALDIAAFILADGRRITVKNGWRGSPEEQGFLHDVQSFACDTFNTVLAPGYNAAHYDHIHVDLMRRASGRRPCQPAAVPGEVVAAKARAVYAAKHGTAYTGSIAAKAAKPGQTPAAIPGADGLDDEDADDAVTGSIGNDDVTGTIAAPAPTGWPRLAPQAAKPRYRPDPTNF
jgi:hypothetical protein